MGLDQFDIHFRAVSSWMVVGDQNSVDKKNDAYKEAVDDGQQEQTEDTESSSSAPDALRDVLYPAEAKVRVFDLYQEDYSDQDELDRVETLAEQGGVV